jgi:hypothetical protein
MEDPVRTLELLIAQKQAELNSITTGGWQPYQRHETGQQNHLQPINNEKQHELRGRRFVIWKAW